MLDALPDPAATAGPFGTRIGHKLRTDSAPPRRVHQNRESRVTHMTIRQREGSAMRHGLVRGALIAAAVLAAAACSNGTPAAPASTTTTTAPALPAAAASTAQPGNRGRGGSGRQAVPRPVLGRPVRPVVDAARAVRAARGQPGDLGCGAPGLPVSGRRARLQRQGHHLDRQHGGRHRHPGRCRGEPCIGVRVADLLGGPVGIRPQRPQLLQARQRQGRHRRGQGSGVLRLKLNACVRTAAIESTAIVRTQAVAGMEDWRPLHERTAPWDFSA